MIVSITGVGELDKKLKSLTKSVQSKIIKKAMTAGTKVVAQAIRRLMPSSFKGAKKTIGFRVNKPAKGRFKGVTFAKAGAGVGMSKKRRQGMASKAKGRGTRPGVGIGVGNIMWFLEGTKDRYTGTKRARRGGKRGRGGFRGTEVRIDTGKKKRFTGKLSNSGIVQTAYRSTASVAKQLIIEGLKEGIMKEAIKR